MYVGRRQVLLELILLISISSENFWGKKYMVHRVLDKYFAPKNITHHKLLDNNKQKRFLMALKSTILNLDVILLKVLSVTYGRNDLLNRLLVSHHELKRMP
jgi:hypothetical protein